MRQQLFGSWKSPQPFTRVAELFADAGGERDARDAGQGERGVRRRHERSPLRDDNPDYAALDVRQLHARRRLPELTARRPHPPEGRHQLRRRLRAVASSLDSVGTFTAYAIYNPENVRSSRRRSAKRSTGC